MLASTESSVTYPVAIIKVNGIKCRVLLDTGSASSYASEVIIDLLKINPIKKIYKTIETLTKPLRKNLKFIQQKYKISKTSLAFPSN